MQDVVILGARRTPMGAFNGELAGAAAPALGGVALQGAMIDAKVEPSKIEEVIMGCVLSAGVGQAPGRQAALAAGIPTQVPTTTVNKVCGSAMKSVMMLSDMIRLGDIELGAAGGMESMTNAPYILEKARTGYRMGHGATLDHMFFDGLENAYDHKLMGHFAEETAKKYKFSREDQDAFAIESGQRALKAMNEQIFDDEIVPVKLTWPKSQFEVKHDEPPAKIKFDRISTLRPAFAEDGTVTAANASSIADGAAALVLASAAYAEHHKLKPRAVIRGYTSFAQEPEWFTTAPAGAIQKLLDKLGWGAHEVDLYEINEAFAVVAMATIRDLALLPEKVNVYGGACALGHPLGASGARIIVTLLNALEKKGLKRGIAAICIGGGEATAIAIERVD